MSLRSLQVCLQKETPLIWSYETTISTTDFYVFLGQLNAEKAIEFASVRDPSIGKTIVFQEPAEFWLCSSKEKYGKMVVVVSTRSVKTYQVLHDGIDM